MTKLYQDREVMLISKHKKEAAIQALIEEATGCKLSVVTALDTDRFGTFSREKKRKKSQLDTARLKAKKGLKRTKGDLAISSEGSFGQHPYFPIPWNVELVYLWDKLNSFELYGIHESSQTNFDSIETTAFLELNAFAHRIGFPDHWLILRPDGPNSKRIIKDINTLDKLEESFYTCAIASSTGKVFAETDMRAHANPTRMENIRKATENLLSKLLNFCPKCNAPGFSISRSVKGLPCSHCGLPSELILKQIYTCQKCSHEAEYPGPNGAYASPQYCNYCNP